MSWVTVVWSMIASACFTLAAMYFLVWWRHRAARAPLLFSVAAVSTAVFAFFELRMMRAETAAQLLSVLTWGHVPLFFLLVSVAWFVRIHLGAGRPWLAWTITGLGAIALVVNLVLGQTLSVREVTTVRHVDFLGESVTVLGGVPNSATPLTQFATLLILVFVADAALTAWRRGDRRRALMVGGSVEFFLIGALGTAMVILWGDFQVPLVFSVFYLGLVAVMAYELSRDVIRASELVRELQVRESTLHDLSGRLLSAQEDERRRIARELHDNLSQQMAALAIGISQVTRKLGDTPHEPVARSIRDLGQRTAEISEEMHSLSHRLHSSKLAALGLVEALRGHCQEVTTHGVDVRFDHENVPRSMPHDVEICLFRIVQEGLNNVVKHSGARQAQVTLRGTADVLALSILDSGRGFDKDSSDVPDGLGLASMRERLRLIQGELSIRSQPGQGTTIVASVPIPRVGSSAEQP